MICCCSCATRCSLAALSGLLAVFGCTPDAGPEGDAALASVSAPAACVVAGAVANEKPGAEAPKKPPPVCAAVEPNRPPPLCAAVEPKVPPPLCAAEPKNSVGAAALAPPNKPALVAAAGWAPKSEAELAAPNRPAPDEAAPNSDAPEVAPNMSPPRARVSRKRGAP